jgi:hypothetical protein
MSTSCAPSTGRGVQPRAVVVSAAVITALFAAFTAVEHYTTDPVFPYVESEEEFLEELEEDFGIDGSALADLVSENDPLAIEAAFPRESYEPGTTATLRVWTTLDRAAVRLYRVGPERVRTVGNREMQGVPMSARVALGPIRRHGIVRLELGHWPSGLYFAKLTGAGDRVGFAPFILRPERLGVHRVAVVLPTHTWQAYNLRDDDGDGRGDTWYANWSRLTARLGRPYLNRGVPPHFRQYDLHFLHWLHWSGKRADILSQSDLDALDDGRELRRAYDLIVFPGHHEYVTRREYDAVERYRDLGGSLAFLSANNFFWRIDIKGDAMLRLRKWRDLGRPESSLLGVQYRANDRGERRAPWLVRRAPAASWLFDGIRLENGNEFGSAGIEIDATTPSSPVGTQVVAEIPNLFGPGFTGQMTYYETHEGSKVFAAGAFSLAGAIREPEVARLVQNVWQRLTPAAVEPTSPAVTGWLARKRTVRL